MDPACQTPASWKTLRETMRGGPDYPQIKRFSERCLADPALVEKARKHPAAVASLAGITLDPLDFRQIWDLEHAHAVCGQEASPLAQQGQSALQARVAFRNMMREACAEVVPRYGRWRQRQMARSALELHAKAAETIVHSPLSVELSLGCSGGCWFCGLAAPRLSATHPYTEDTAREWRAMLAGLSEVIGPAIRYGFCYWATDPLDNPDYERFACDFDDVLGVFPQFTTALALRAPERTRKLLRLAEQRQGIINRFSLLSLAQLEKAHAAFTAEELAMVECLPQNSQSRIVLATTGRARERGDRLSAQNASLPVAVQPSTIACVSGFLINMVERTVRLVSPCPASDRWPLGYRLWAQASFAGVDDLLAGVQSMIDSNMVQSVTELPKVLFNEIVTYTPQADGFRLNSEMREIRYCGAAPDDADSVYLRALGQMVADGASSADEIALLAFYRHGVPAETTLGWLEDLFDKGLLREAV